MTQMMYDYRAVVESSVKGPLRPAAKGAGSVSQPHLSTTQFDFFKSARKSRTDAVFFFVDRIGPI